MHTLLMNGLPNITGSAVHKMLSAAPNLENLTVAGCEQLVEYDLQSILTNGKVLEYVDFNHIPIVTPAFFDELKEMKPSLKIK
jgi:hypothetical protein